MCYLNYRLQPYYLSKLRTLALTRKSKSHRPYFKSLLLTIITHLVCMPLLSEGRPGRPGTFKKKMDFLRSGIKFVSLFNDFPFRLLVCYVCLFPLTDLASDFSMTMITFGTICCTAACKLEMLFASNLSCLC